MSKIGKISYLICGLSLVILMVARLILGGWINYLFVPLGLAAVTFFAALIVDYKFYLEFFSMRTTKHGLNMGTLILMGLALVVVVNYAGKRFDQSLDLTTEKLHSLSDQSIKVLENLKSDVKIFVFYRGADQKQGRQQVKESLQTYLDESPKLKLEFVNSLVDVQKAKEYLKSFDQMAVIAESEGRRVTIEEPYDEEKVTAALIKLSKTEQQSVYFLSGHGEKDIDTPGPEGLSDLKEALTASSYTVSKINLLKGDKLPTNDAVLAIVGPKTALLENELTEIRKFAKSGGSLLIAVDPGEKHQAALLTKSLGVEFKNNYVLNDRVRLLGVGMAAILGMQFDVESDITKGFAGAENYALFFLASEVVRAPEAAPTLVFKDIVKTEGSAFAVDRVDQQISGEHARREHVLAVTAQGTLDEAAGEGTKPEFRAAFFGDSDFVGNQVLFQGVNRDLVLNTLAFLAKDDAMISIRPKRPEGSQMTMTQTQQIGVVIAGVCFPLALIILSGVMWYRRKGL
jgi:ABC-type uncharacterized transport system involved in gliding motility auxiliary subunit